MSRFKHEVYAYTLRKRHLECKSLYLYCGYSRVAKAIVGGDEVKYLAVTFCSNEAAKEWLFQRLVARIHDVNTVHHGGSTALMFAAANNQLDVVISLMTYPRIDLNVQHRRYNHTALHYAVANNHPAIVSQLLSDDKIDASLKDDDNRSALKRAIDMGRAECVTILRQHGAPEE